LTGGGKTGAFIRAHDWTGSPLGGPDAWPPTLRAAVSLMLGSSFPMYVAYGPELRLLYNDGYARILGTKHPAALGAPIAEVWPEAWPHMKTIMSAALSGKKGVLKNLPLKLQRSRTDEQAYFTFSYSPFRDDDGQIQGVFCNSQETTGEVLAHRTLVSEAERLRDLFGQAPGFMAIFQGPEHVIEIVNGAYQSLVGDRDLIGKPVREALPEVEGQGFFEILDHVYQTGETFVGRRLPVFLRRTPETEPEEAIVDFVYQPIRDASGQVTGIFIEGSDVTETARMDQQRQASDRFAQATIDALSEHIAVIDEQGIILAVNRAWREFGAANGLTEADCEGVNYLDACDRAATTGDPSAAAAALLIREVASGKRPEASWQYACHSPSEERWFAVKVTRFQDPGPARVVIAHENVTELKQREKRIQYLATHDALTGLPNRRLLEDRAQQAIGYLGRKDLGLAVLFVDLDNFKNINDAYGHQVGDFALKTVSEIISRAVRRGDTVSRMGGDEFVLLLTNLKNPALTASNVARKIIERFNKPLKLNELEATITVSIGISAYPSDGEELEELLRNADTALHWAKGRGRNSFQFYAAEMSARSNERILMEHELRRALKKGQFELHYQPQVQLETGDLRAIEALIRWPHPELGLIPPDRFIKISEETGLIIPIGHWVLKTACAQNRAWQKVGFRAIPVAVNISASQLRHPDFIGMVGDVLDETGLDPCWLDLEITEGTAMDRTEDTIARLNALKSLGIKLSIDDFGTGYSNLGYLHNFPIDQLKIDRSFVSALPDDPTAASLTHAVIALGQGLGLQVIAEGVETKEQMEFLIVAGCDLAQGYYFSKPLKPPEMKQWLQLRGPARLRVVGRR
jgi:diguanylate cyclase (GGDEF)-like protein/PAS domain S-box-containing protein